MALMNGICEECQLDLNHCSCEKIMEWDAVLSLQKLMGARGLNLQSVQNAVDFLFDLSSNTSLEVYQQAEMSVAVGDFRKTKVYQLWYLKRKERLKIDERCGSETIVLYEKPECEPNADLEVVFEEKESLAKSRGVRIKVEREDEEEEEEEEVVEVEVMEDGEERKNAVGKDDGDGGNGEEEEKEEVEEVEEVVDEDMVDGEERKNADGKDGDDKDAGDAVPRTSGEEFKLKCLSEVKGRLQKDLELVCKEKEWLGEMIARMKVERDKAKAELIARMKVDRAKAKAEEEEEEVEVQDMVDGAERSQSETIGANAVRRAKAEEEKEEEEEEEKAEEEKAEEEEKVEDMVDGEERSQSETIRANAVPRTLGDAWKRLHEILLKEIENDKDGDEDADKDVDNDDGEDGKDEDSCACDDEIPSMMEG